MFIRYDWVQLMQMTATMIEDRSTLTTPNLMAYIDQLYACGLDDEAKIYEVSLRYPNILYRVIRNSDGSYIMSWGGNNSDADTQKDRERLVLKRLEFVPRWVYMSFLGGHPQYLAMPLDTFLKGGHRLCNLFAFKECSIQRWPFEQLRSETNSVRVLCPSNPYGHDYTVGLTVLQARNEIFHLFPGTISASRLRMGTYRNGTPIDYMFKEYPRTTNITSMVDIAAMKWARSQKEETGGTYCE